jgi:phage gp36-like protein
MAFLVKADLNTKLYGEILDEITRSDDTIVTKAINAGLAEVKSYLSRYDLTALFADAFDETLSEHLKNVCKDVICWTIIKLANPNIDLKLFRTNYEDAITWLTKIQKGQVDPTGWPYKPDDAATKGFNENNTVQFSSNCKRRQHF